MTEFRDNIDVTVLFNVFLHSKHIWMFYFQHYLDLAFDGFLIPLLCRILVELFDSNDFVCFPGETFVDGTERTSTQELTVIDEIVFVYGPCFACQTSLLHICSDNTFYTFQKEICFNIIFIILSC
jgi:hypothetical protein